MINTDPRLGDPRDDLVLTRAMRVRDRRSGRSLAIALAIFVLVLTWPGGLILLNWLTGGYR